MRLYLDQQCTTGAGTGSGAVTAAYGAFTATSAQQFQYLAEDEAPTTAAPTPTVVSTPTPSAAEPTTPAPTSAGPSAGTYLGGAWLGMLRMLTLTMSRVLQVAPPPGLALPPYVLPLIAGLGGVVFLGAVVVFVVYLCNRRQRKNRRKVEGKDGAHPPAWQSSRANLTKPTAAGPYGMRAQREVESI